MPDGAKPAAANRTATERAIEAGITPGTHKWFVLSVVSVGTFMATLDGSIVNISLPTIQSAFGVSLSAIEWVVVAYLLTVGTLLLPFGRAGELLGYKRVYVTGFVFFTAASVLCGLSLTIWMLVVFRIIQGIGASMLQAMGPAIVAATFGPRERGRALGLNSVSVSVGLSVGPTIGGILTEYGSWRWIFYINLPVGIFAILWAMRVLERERHGGQDQFDIRGATLQLAALLSLLLALIEGQSWGWTSSLVVGLLAAFVVFGAAFIMTELRSPHPMLDLRLFKIRPFSAGNGALMISFAALFTATFLMPFFLIQGEGFSTLRAGLLLTPIPLTTMIFAPLSGALSDRIGQRIPATAGLAVMALGLYLLTGIRIGMPTWDLVVRLMVIGVGQGLFTSPNSSAVLGSVPRARLGTASATLAQMRIDGQAVGIAAAGAIVAAQTAAYVAKLSGTLAPELVQREAFVHAIHDAFFVAAIVCLFAILASMVRGPRLEEEIGPANTNHG
ncbi:MAG TPA: MFS transporter [Nitrolancea sp.]|nr:MFS transporter [Nitrolancea sp.]